MNRRLLLLALLLAARGHAAPRVEAPPLPSGGCSDSEASTNVAVRAASGADNRFCLTFELDAATNGCALVEFGVDADASGALERREVEFSVGWDCGAWVWRDRRGGCAASAVREAGRLRLDWTVLLGPDKAARRLVAQDRWTVFDGSVPATFHSPAWNMARIVRRGPEAEVRVAFGASVFPLSVRVR